MKNQTTLITQSARDIHFQLMYYFTRKMIKAEEMNINKKTVSLIRLKRTDQRQKIPSGFGFRSRVIVYAHQECSVTMDLVAVEMEF